VITTTPGIPDPADIVEVDGFRPISKTPQHDGMQRWCSLTPKQLFGRPPEREEREVEMVHQGVERRTRGSFMCVLISPWGTFIWWGGGSLTPPPRNHKGGGQGEE
jgi:hypothetical protein